MISILVVEDDEKLNQIVCETLIGNGFATQGLLNPKDAFYLMREQNFDLIVSDIMMPEIDGFEFADSVRRLNKVIPILFITARDDIASKQKGFRAGVDDYMVKPIDLDELILRVEALLRRTNISSEKRLIVGNLTMNADEYSVTIDGKDISVTFREFSILYRLLTYPKKTFSRQQLIDDFWNINSETTLRAVDVYITKLRTKFATCDGFKIETVFGIGYKAILI